MLRSFSVQGFKNFDKNITINFANVRGYPFHTECVTDGLLNTIIIYGKNAAGKSNLGLALFDIVSHLTMNNVTPGLYDYYLNANHKEEFASFEYEFEFGEDEIIYGYTKSDINELESEYLMINGTVIFHHGKINTENNGLIELAPHLNWELNTEMSSLKYLFYNSTLDADHPISKMMKYVARMLWFRSLDENRFIGYKEKSRDYLTFMLENKNYINEFNTLLKQAGVNDSVVVKKDTDGEKRLYFDTKAPMPFLKTASSGTKSLYTFYYWYKTAPDVSFMYIDEFDAFYHHELSETIVGILEKMGGFQKILTSHNTNLLSNRIMRPDCYYLLTQDRLTSLADATVRELREGHNLEKLYMSGEFNG